MRQCRPRAGKGSALMDLLSLDASATATLVGVMGVSNMRQLVGAAVVVVDGNRDYSFVGIETPESEEDSMQTEYGIFIGYFCKVRMSILQRLHKLKT